MSGLTITTVGWRLKNQRTDTVFTVKPWLILLDHYNWPHPHYCFISLALTTKVFALDVAAWYRGSLRWWNLMQLRCWNNYPEKKCSELYMGNNPSIPRDERQAWLFFTPIMMITVLYHWRWQLRPHKKHYHRWSSVWPCKTGGGLMKSGRLYRLTSGFNGFSPVSYETTAHRLTCHWHTLFGLSSWTTSLNIYYQPRQPKLRVRINNGCLAVARHWCN